MSTADSNPAMRKWAIALITICLLSMASPFIAYFQTRVQLAGDYIPKTIVINIIAPFMTDGIICVIVTLIAFIFFVYSRFLYTIITCCAGIVLVQIFPYFIYRLF